jgi:hypothetical protein
MGIVSTFFFFVFTIFFHNKKYIDELSGSQRVHSHCFYAPYYVEQKTKSNFIP